ncbi:MAG: hypothetical protein VKN60_09035 [Cyanobacteriota bacterium]|nr:hypothetical protein [Cyanobacteriota bacterium]
MSWSVVGADGIHSAVRRGIYRGTPLEPWAQPQYSGWAGLGCLPTTKTGADPGSNRFNRRP